MAIKSQLFNYNRVAEQYNTHNIIEWGKPSSRKIDMNLQMIYVNEDIIIY